MLSAEEMARHHTPTTFCEVTYDSDWLHSEDDRHLTPYRYSLMRNDTDTNSDTVSLTLPSYTYYEYLRSLYDCRTTPNRAPPGYTGHPGSHISQQGRSITWHAFNKDTGSELSRQAVRSEPTRTRPTYPFPSLHLIQGGDSGDELEENYVYTDRTKEKLVWVDALNKWVPQKQLYPRPYMSFIGNAPVVEKQGTFQKEYHGGGDEVAAVHNCERYEVHMGQRTSVSQPQDKYANKQQNNEKREAIRRRAQEVAEQRRQRKAYSTPLYTSMTERKKNLTKPRVQSSHARTSQPVSFIQPREKMPAPKQVWQAEETPKLQTIHEPKPRPVSPLKKEISITLMPPQPEDDDYELDNEKDEESDKKVTFNDEDKTTAKPENEKKEEEDYLSNNEEEMKLAEKQRRESLEKQKLEQQKLLAEEQRKEKERKEKERLAEEERLRRLKESHMHKPPLTNKNQNHNNHYEHTMNAAAKRRKSKGANKTRIKPAKLDKSPQNSKKLEVEKPAAEQMPKPVAKLERAKPKPEPPSKPILTGMGAQQKPLPALAPSTKPEQKEKLPISKPSDIEPIIEEEEVVKPQSATRERLNNIKEQWDVVKKERRDARKCAKKVEEVETEELPEAEIGPRKIKSWIYEAVDFSDKIVRERETNPTEPFASLSSDLTPELIEKRKVEKKEQRRKAVLSRLISADNAVKLWKKPVNLDKSYADELRRLEVAEERRKKQMDMFERIKNNKTSMLGDGIDDGTPRFEDYGFLSKYCIFTQGNIEMYRYAFDAVDETKSGWLEGEDVMIALRGVNNKLTEAEEEYLYRVLELTGYKLTHGADFKVFSVLAALSQRISALDKWMKNLIGQMDFKALEMKMFKCKALWECNVDKETNSISIDQLCVDLRAGGVSCEHEMEVREKLAHLRALDLLDFLTYIPLFIMIHEAVVQNPLDDTRTK